MHIHDEEERLRIERKLDAMDRETQRLIDAYQANVIALDELKERRERIAAHGKLLRKRLDEIRRLRADREQQLRLLNGLDGFCASIRDMLEEPSLQTKQKVLQLVVDRIIVDEAKLVVQHVIPTGPVRLQTEHHVTGTPTSTRTGISHRRVVRKTLSSTHDIWKPSNRVFRRPLSRTRQHKEP